MKNLPNFSIEECNRIIDLAVESNLVPRNGDFTLASVTHSSISYDSFIIKYTDQTDWIFNRINQFLLINDGIEIKSNLKVLNIHRYSAGDQFIKHRDNYYPTQFMNVGAVLNEDFEGGEFIVYEPKQAFPKKAGMIYSYRNTRLHEVKKIANGVRWSLIGFILKENIKLDSSLL